MRLSDFFPTEQIFRDGEFSALGLSNSDGPEGMLSFLEDARFASELLDNPRIRAVICRPEDGAAVAERKQGVVLSDTPRLTYFQLHNRLAELPDYCPPQTPSVIPESCHVSPLAYIAPTGVVLGENVTVEEFVSIHGPCRVGDNTVLHAGVKLGGPGYEFKYLPEGGVLDIAHCGGVAVGADVVLFENVTVHRAVYPWDETVIGDECRVNAQSHIDHGVKLGRRVKVCAGCVISGRVRCEVRSRCRRVQPPDRRGRRPGAAGQRGVQGRPRRSGCLRQLRRGPRRPSGGGQGRRPEILKKRARML